ncbi:MAG: hypothetical protein F6K48_09850 [Okeania sp. SIO3H1]|nr:hypothetical protein [Okeania sp. SIO3H1]
MANENVLIKSNSSSAWKEVYSDSFLKVNVKHPDEFAVGLSGESLIARITIKLESKFQNGLLKNIKVLVTPQDEGPTGIDLLEPRVGVSSSQLDTSMLWDKVGDLAHEDTANKSFWFGVTYNGSKENWDAVPTLYTNIIVLRPSYEVEYSHKYARTVGVRIPTKKH